MSTPNSSQSLVRFDKNHNIGFCDFDENYETFVQILNELTGISLGFIKSKPQTQLFYKYLTRLCVWKIVIEPNYVDKDYLEDFSTYFSHCHNSKNYSGRCQRLHLFSKEFPSMLSSEDNDFDESFTSYICSGISKEEQEKIQKNYCGFIVIKPLPQTFFGKTCLKTYPNDLSTKRYYNSLRIYDVNIFGKEFNIESVAFQEQDHVLAACATSALWSAFHITGKKFQHCIPSPSKITKIATSKSQNATRVFPSEGLSGYNISLAISEIGLEPLKITYEKTYNFNKLKELLYSYLAYNIPIIMLIYLKEKEISFIRKKRIIYQGLKKNGKKRKVITDSKEDSHAVTIVGYNFRNSEEIISKDKGPRFLAWKMDEIYVHDDGIGPFASMKFDDVEFLTSWRGKEDNNYNLLNKVYWSKRAKLTSLIIPIDHRIRIKYDTIKNYINKINEIISYIFEINERKMNYLWDVGLISVKSLKEKISQSKRYSAEDKKTILFKDLPRYIWSAEIVSNDEAPIGLNLIFDATDIEQANLLSYVVLSDEFIYMFSEFINSLNKNGWEVLPTREGKHFLEKIQEIYFKIKYDTIVQYINKIKDIVSLIMGNSEPKMNFFWDVRLISVKSLKEKISQSKCYSDENKKTLLFKDLSRYIWSAEIVSNNEAPIGLNLIFDDTDNEQANLLSYIMLSDVFINQFSVFINSFSKNEWKVLVRERKQFLEKIEEIYFKKEPISGD